MRETEPTVLEGGGMESMGRKEGASRSKEQPPSDSEDMGPQYYSCKKLNLANNLENPGSRFILRAFIKECSPADNLNLAL